MLRFKTSPCLLFVGLIICSRGLHAFSRAEAPHTLRWKFAVGDSLDYAIEQQVVTTINVEGVEFTARTSLILDVAWTVKETNQEVAEIEQRVRRVRLDVHAPRGGALGDLQYDSQDGTEGTGRIWDAARPVLLALPESTTMLRVTSLGEVRQVAISDDLADAIKKLPSTPLLAGSNVLSEEGLRQLLELAVQTLPEQPVGEGGAWTRQVERQVPTAGKIIIDLSNELAGPARLGERDCVQLDLKSEGRYEPPEEESRDLKLDLDESSGSGTAHFDAAAGRTLASRFRQSLLVTGEFRGASFTQEIATRLAVTLAGCESPPDDDESEP